MDQQPSQNLNWGLSEPVCCEECGNKVFTQGVYLRKLSKILAATDRDVVRPFPTFSCTKCGHVNKEFVMFENKPEEPLQSPQSTQVGNKA